MNEPKIVRIYLNTVLNDTGNSAMQTACPGGWWPDKIPQQSVLGVAVPFPAGTYQLYSPGNDLVVINNTRIWSDMEWLIKASAIVGQDATLDDAVDLMDDLLKDVRYQAVGSDGAMIYAISRLRPFSQPVDEDGVSYRQEGGFYRVQVRAG